MIRFYYLPSFVRAAGLWVFVSSFALAPYLFGAETKLEFPDASQHATIKQRVGLTDVEIDYSRPNMRSREIFGGLVPFGKVWRTGANAATKIKFSDAVKIGGKDVPAGEYAFYTIPNKDEWTIVLSKNTKLWGAYEYKEDADAVRVAVKPTALANPVESFTIGFENLKDDGATIALEWDKTRVPVELKSNTVEKVNGEIEAALKNPKSLEPRFYYQAASFYYDHDKDLEQAAKWIDQAIEKQQPARYFMFYKKAQIEAKLGHKAEAKAAAEKSIELLKAEKEPDETAIRNSQLIIDGLR
jgi:tetratricopeptide (TPR) repeat protein